MFSCLIIRTCYTLKAAACFQRVSCMRCRLVWTIFNFSSFFFSGFFILLYLALVEVSTMNICECLDAGNIYGIIYSYVVAKPITHWPHHSQLIIWCSSTWGVIIYTFVLLIGLLRRTESHQKMPVCVVLRSNGWLIVCVSCYWHSWNFYSNSPNSFFSLFMMSGRCNCIVSMSQWRKCAKIVEK